MTVWDTKRGEPLRKGKKAGRVLAVSRTGKFVLGIAPEGKPALWDVEKGESTGMPGKLSVDAAVFSGDSNQLALKGVKPGKEKEDEWTRGVWLWDGAAGKEPVLLAKEADAWGFASSPDGALLATFSGQGARLWDWRKKTVLRHLRLPRNASISEFRFSEDGKRLAGMGITIQGSVAVPVEGAEPAEPDAKGDEGIEEPDAGRAWSLVWNTATGERLTPKLLQGDHRLDAALAFSRDGARLLALSGKTNGGELRSWRLPDEDAGSGRLAGSGGDEGFVEAWFSDDGKHVVQKAGRERKAWAIATGKQVPPGDIEPDRPTFESMKTVPKFVTRMRSQEFLDSDGMRKAVETTYTEAEMVTVVERRSWAGKGVNRPSAEMARPTLAGKWDMLHESPSRTLYVFRENGAAGWHGLRVWDARSAKLLTPPLWLPQPSTCAFSDDGAFLAVTGDGWVQLWDVGPGEALTPLMQCPGIAWARFSPDGQTLLTCSLAGKDKRAAQAGLRLWPLRAEGKAGLAVLKARCALICSMRLDRGGDFVSLSARRIREAAEDLKHLRHPRGSFPTEEAWIAWQRERAKECADAWLFAPAARALNAILAAKPDDAPSLHARGVVFAEQGEWGRAREEFDKALLLDAGSGRAAAYRAMLDAQAGDTEGCRKRCAELLSKRLEGADDDLASLIAEALLPAAGRDRGSRGAAGGAPQAHRRIPIGGVAHRGRSRPLARGQGQGSH